MYYEYNGIFMELTRTNAIAFEAVYSSDGMDYLYTRVLVDVSAGINPQTMAYTLSSGVPTATPGTRPATTVAAIRHALLQPRQLLVITDFVGQTMLRCPLDGYEVDARDGPKPLACTVDAVQGAQAFMIRWKCECHIVECPSGASAPVILSHRWSDSHHINEHHLTTRVANGRVVFRKDFLDAMDAFPDDFRGLLLPSVSRGMRRVSIDAMQNSAGTELMWRVVDREQVFELGETDARNGQTDGILSVDGRQTISSEGAPGGAITGVTMNNLFLRASGNLYSNQWVMIQSLFSLATSVMAIGQPEVGHLVHASVSRSLSQDEKWVELHLGFLQNPTDVAVIGNINIQPLRFDVGDLPWGGPGSPGVPNDNSTRGTFTAAKLIAQELTQACEGPGQLHATGSGGQGPPQEPTGDPPAVNTYTRDILPEEPTSYDPGEPEYPYTSYKLDSRYETEMNVLHAPVAGSPSADTSETPSTVVFRTAAPLTRLIISGVAERIGAYPILPNPVPTDENLVLRRCFVNPDFSIVLSDGVTPVTRVAIHYEYALIEPPDLTSPNYRVGVLPWTTIPTSDTTLGPQNFSDEIADI